MASLKHLTLTLKMIIVLWACCLSIYLQAQAKGNFYYNDLSESLLEAALKRENTESYRQELATVPIDTLVAYLDDDTKKIAFWVNVYNAYIQHLLQSNPEQFDDKRKFFSSKQIRLFNKEISLEKIEHGIIRKSQWKFGMGNIRTFFPPRFEKKLRVKQRDPRIHFALNCGAKSCPPVLVLRPEKLDAQLRKNTRNYIQQTSRYDAERNVVHITPLFCWFRGDFGNKKGIRKMLANEGIIPRTVKPKIQKTAYDWTLDLDNYSLN